MATESVVRPGTVLDGKYEILERIGAGGMGEVFKARHVHLDAPRCIKVMRATIMADDSFRQRFLREARLATQIHHPNIAVVHDFFVGDGSSYMVSEYIDGTTVRQWSARNGPFPLGVAADVASQVLAGLEFIHRRGLLHRDISPDNVMLSFDEDARLVVKIIDLGIAKETASDGLTQAGALIGNPKYMSPEQFGTLGEGEALDGRADLYCLGVVLYEMLLGVPPFVSETPQGYIMKHLTEAPPKPREVRPGSPWPDGMEAVLFRALEKDRRRRFNDARDFAGTLQKFLTSPSGSLTRNDIERLRGGSAVTIEERFDTGAYDFDATVTEKNADEPADFDAAWEKGSSTAWDEYLAAHPLSPRLDLARRCRQEAADFELAVAMNTRTMWRAFLKTWTDGRHRIDAEIRARAV
jgi:eukaryotic-like serine/threonine-protein kinase